MDGRGIQFLIRRPWSILTLRWSSAVRWTYCRWSRRIRQQSLKYKAISKLFYSPRGSPT